MSFVAEVVPANERLGDVARRSVELSPGGEAVIADYIEKLAGKQKL